MEATTVLGCGDWSVWGEGNTEYDTQGNTDSDTQGNTEYDSQENTEYDTQGNTVYDTQGNTEYDTQENTEYDSAFGEWGSVDSKSEAIELSSTSSFGHSTQVQSSDVKTPWQTCFQDFSDSEETDCVVPSLSQLLLNTPETPSQPDTSTSDGVSLLSDGASLLSDSASLWSCLLTGQKRLRLYKPRPRLHSTTGLVSALRLAPPDPRAGQCVPLCLDDHEETEPPTAAPLILTKLVPPSSCRRDAPVFIYQISQQWLAQCRLQLHPQHCRKTLH